MKRIIGGLFGGTLLFTACKENHNLVSISNPVSVSVDTTYILPPSLIPAADAHNVLIEDFTGVTCTNCPGAHDNILVPIESSNPHGRINIVELFVTDFPQTGPNVGELYNGFRDTVATKIENSVYTSLVVIPIAGIDRMPLGTDGLNNTQVKSSSWTSGVNGRLTTTDALNLSVVSSFDSASRTATIVTKITYLDTTTALQNLSVVVVEDSFTDLQEFPDSVAWYNYNSVFRGLVTAVPFGDPISPSLPLKEKGRVCQKVYSYHVNAAWKSKHCRVIAFVHGDGSQAGQHVYQSWQTPLAP